jgi:oligopeptide/dipeptide ABC transporter ATP-binding protein
MLGLSIMRLVPEPGRIVGGEVRLNGLNLLDLAETEMRRVRGKKIGMIFQDPSSSLNPVMTIGWQVRETIRAHHTTAAAECHRRSIEMLRAVRIPEPDIRARDFPHQYSGGMRQRVMIAIGMANRPALLIADEPTTALDVTVQAQIIELLRALYKETGAAIILITHNIALVSRFCSRVLVMYAGQVVESGPTLEVFEAPQHPYTAALLNAVPRVDVRMGEGLSAIEGRPPDLAKKPTGCAFHPRCAVRLEICDKVEPPLRVSDARTARCWLLETGAGSNESIAERNHDAVPREREGTSGGEYS